MENAKFIISLWLRTQFLSLDIEVKKIKFAGKSES
jgi:hypothetical protein